MSFHTMSYMNITYSKNNRQTICSDFVTSHMLLLNMRYLFSTQMVQNVMHVKRPNLKTLLSEEGIPFPKI